MSLLLAVSYAKKLGIPNKRKKLKIYSVSPASKIKITAHRNLQIVSPIIINFCFPSLVSEKRICSFNVRLSPSFVREHPRDPAA